LKTIYETHLWEGKFEVKRNIVWVLGVLAFSALSGFLAFRRFGVVWVLGVPTLSGLSAFSVFCASLSSTLSSPNSQKRKRNKKRKGAREEERGEIPRKGKERGAEEERGETGKEKKIIKKQMAWRNLEPNLEMDFDITYFGERMKSLMQRWFSKISPKFG
jgi:hypothetical protein